MGGDNMTQGYITGRPAVTPLPITEGGTQLETITDHGILLGSGTDAITPTAAPTLGQILVGKTSADPNLITSFMQQGNNGWFLNLAFTHDDTTLTISGASAALSVTNPGYVVMGSNATDGKLVIHEMVADVNITETNCTNNLFGSTAARSWTNSLPMYVCCFADSSDANLEWGLTRLPNIKTTPATSGDIGDPSAANADKEWSVLSFDDITQTNYLTMKTAVIGSFRMQKSSSDVWTFVTMDAYDGAGQWNENRKFTFVAGQGGADATVYGTGDGGGTFGTFNSVLWYYYVRRYGELEVDIHLVTADATFAGTNALLLAMPYQHIGDGYNGGGGTILNYWDNSGGVSYTGVTFWRVTTESGIALVQKNIRAAGRFQLDNVDISDQIYCHGVYSIQQHE